MFFFSGVQPYSSSAKNRSSSEPELNINSVQNVRATRPMLLRSDSEGCVLSGSRTGEFRSVNGTAQVWLLIAWEWKRQRNCCQSFVNFSSDAKKKYFIDIYHAKSKSSESHFELVWIQPGNLSRYELINARFLSFYINETDEFSSLRYLHKLPDSTTRNKAKQNSPTMNEHFTLKSIPYLESDTVSNILPSCQYKPSYLILEKIRVPWSAVYKHWHPVRIYPFIRLKNVSKSRNHEIGRASCRERV